MEVPNIAVGDIVTIPFLTLKQLSDAKEIPKPPAKIRGRKIRLYKFTVDRFNNDGETIQASLFRPQFDYNVVLSYKYFTKQNDGTPKRSPRIQKRVSDANQGVTAGNNPVPTGNGIPNDGQLKDLLDRTVPRILSSFSLPEPENATKPSTSIDVPENASGNVLRMSISLAESKVQYYETLANNARNHLTRLKEKHAADDPDDMLGTMKEIQIKSLHEEYFKKMMDIFNDEPVMPYEFLNIWDDKYPVLDFSMVQRLPLIITFKKSAEYEQAFEEYMKGTMIFNLLDGRRIYGSLKVPIWESSRLGTDKPIMLNGAESVVRFALPFKNTAVLMYACRGFGCRFYRSNRRTVRQHEMVTGHFIEQEKGSQSNDKNESAVSTSTIQQGVKREYRYSSDDSVVETEVTRAREITVTKNRRRPRKRASEQGKIKFEENRRSSSEDSLIEVGVFQLDEQGRKRPFERSRVPVPLNKPKLEMKQEEYLSDDSVIEVGIIRPDKNGL